MGCDIHTYIERNVNDNTWQYLKDIRCYGHRNYFLFGLLADVRNYDEVTPIDLPRGLPKDISQDVHNYCQFWNGDGHSHSWYLIDELLNWNGWQEIFTTGTRWYNEGERMKYNEICQDFLEWLKSIHDNNPGVTRMVFWFDN